MTADDELQRERAYRLWEEEGRPDGRHDDHWRQAGEPPLAEQESEDVTKTNQEADQEFADSDDGTKSDVNIKPPSAISPD